MFEDEDINFDVVANHEEQYSIWPTFKEIPAGWIAVGPSGPKDECLDYIDRVWTDMRPKSLRDKMSDGGDGADGEVDEELRAAVDDVLTEHEDRIEEYTDGRPELYGWFFARVVETLDEQDLDRDPTAVRAALDDRLPAHQIPEEYA